MSSFIIFNGSFYPSGSPLVSADNRGLRYGDGLFETIRVEEGRILLRDHHYQRLLNGSRLLGFEPLTLESFTEQILQLCERNGHTASARVRLTVFRGDMGQSDALSDHIIQSWSLEAAAAVPDARGLSVGVFPRGRKSCDVFANLKSNNYLMYSMAAAYARGHGWDDCLVLNSQGRIADSSIANLFYIKGGAVHTPPLAEGCVAGVMREWLIGTLPGAGFAVHERPVAPEDLLTADEVFLTNAIRGVRWVGSFGGVTFGCEVVQAIKKIEYEGLR